MKRFVLAVILGLTGGVGHAITVNPASNVTADSEATANTIVLRDASGNSAINSLSATGSISVTTATVGAVTGSFRGAFTSGQLAVLSASPGDIAINATTTQLVMSSATLATGALPGAWISISTSPNYTKLPGY